MDSLLGDPGGTLSHEPGQVGLHDMLSIAEAQENMRDAYVGGAAGLATSATAWLIAAIVATTVSPGSGIVALVLGGMLIFPVSVLLCRAIGRSGRHSKANPLAPLAIEGTIWMIFCIFIATGVALYRAEWFFPAMLLIIGGRYLTFVTLYGLRIYWFLGAALAIAAILLIASSAPAVCGAYIGAVVEYAFGVAVFSVVKRSAT